MAPYLERGSDGSQVSSSCSSRRGRTPFSCCVLPSRDQQILHQRADSDESSSTPQIFELKNGAKNFFELYDTSRYFPSEM